VTEPAALPSDDLLIAAVRAGDEALFARLLDAWSPSMLRLARSFVASRDSAEEVVQDTWLAVLTGIGAFEGRSALRTWVYRILVNIAKKRGVREKRLVPWRSLLPAESDHGPTVDPARFRGGADQYPGGWRQFPAAWPSTEASVLARELRTIIEDALGSLPARQRVVITLRDVEGHSSEDVCDMLEISPANQRVLLHRARAAVRARLEGYLSNTATEGAR
jgi:RNA polymerase sigma-70 factor, ECF subfamily